MVSGLLKVGEKKLAYKISWWKEQKKGNSTVQYLVQVYRSNNWGDNNFILSTPVTFVPIDENGKKYPWKDN